MFSFAFRKKIFTPLFWQYFAWIYALLDGIYLVYISAPSAPLLSWLSFLQVYPEQTFGEALLGVTVDLPLIYALFQLRKAEPFPKEVEKKNEPHRWGMIQIALWGYSLVLVADLFILALFPMGEVATQSQDSSESYILLGTFAPLMIFWLWIAVEYKQYKWNWWRTTLALNGIFYSLLILWGIFFGPEEQALEQSTFGVDIISILQLLIMLLGLWVFGKMQFGKSK